MVKVISKIIRDAVIYDLWLNEFNELTPINCFLEFIIGIGTNKREQDGIGMFCLSNEIHGIHAIAEKPTRGRLYQHHLLIL